VRLVGATNARIPLSELDGAEATEPKRKAETAAPTRRKPIQNPDRWRRS